MTTTPPFKAASTQTLKWWICDVMQASGVDMTVFHPYSTRAASASKTAFTSGSLKAAMDKGHWYTTYAFYRHYLRKVTLFTPQGTTIVRYLIQPPQANLAPVTPENNTKHTTRKLIYKARGSRKPATPVRRLTKADHIG